jgi:hypothetical protein
LPKATKEGIKAALKQYALASQNAVDQLCRQFASSVQPVGKQTAAKTQNAESSIKKAETLTPACHLQSLPSHLLTLTASFLPCSSNPSSNCKEAQVDISGHFAG